MAELVRDISRRSLLRFAGLAAAAVVAGPIIMKVARVLRRRPLTKDDLAAVPWIGHC